MTAPRMAVIDLRSDLLAPPDNALVSEILAALREPAEFELRGDPRQARVEERIARLLGTEDALLFPTCTMANQCALALLTRPGDAVLTQLDAHVLVSEAGGAAAIAGVQIMAAAGDPAALDVEAWRDALSAARSVQAPRVGAIVIENTHNRSGGRIVAHSAVQSIINTARERGVKVHLDGARLFNASVASGVEASELARGFDTIALSLNKGLGGLFGAALAGSHAVIAEALALRQRLGGGMRRMGVFAAAVESCLDNIPRLAEDHRRARFLAEGISARSDIACLEKVETNIVMIKAPPPWRSAEALRDALAAKGVLTLAMPGGRLRMTIHRGIDDAAIHRATEVFASLL
ncbi:GntG family PLP-dependent aldolase [Terrarubrum flagellatum]|uniref:threonine aldolase family protein n=1 Tax=Terrirubrum flagellatum TaxID=2895980 RepID=UPI003144FE71